MVAEGKADVYPRFAPTMEWDTAAGQAICEALGIQVISKETNDPLLYNKENLLNPWFFVKLMKDQVRKRHIAKSFYLEVDSHLDTILLIMVHYRKSINGIKNWYF